MLSRRFPWFVVALLTVMTGFQVYATWTESQVYDEALELGAGYTYWKKHDFRLNFEQPPLQKYWCSLPLLFMRLNPIGGKVWDDTDDFEFGRTFLYKNSRPPMQILIAGRLMSILLTIGLGLTLALWMRRKYGSQAALIALTFFAFEPNLIAHGHYATTDFSVTAFCFVTVLCWNWFLETRRSTALVFSGVMLGLALGSKLSAAILIPAMAIMMLVQGRPWNWRRYVIAVALGIGVLTCLYLPEARPGSSLIRAIQQTRLHQEGGHPAYLLGMYSQLGWIYYFPVAFAVKTPAGLLLACLVAAAVAMRTKFQSGPWLGLTIAPVLYFAVAMANHVNVGIRHILPVYPFLCALLGIGLVQLTVPWLTAALMLLTATETAARFPYYTAFFNVFAGGPGAAMRYLADSNVDWGQDLLRVKQFMIDHDQGHIYLSYFGGAEPGDFGIWYDGVPRNQDKKERDALDGFVAISETHLAGEYFPDPQWYSWLRDMTPVERIGYSIYVYDLRKHH